MDQSIPGTNSLHIYVKRTAQPCSTLTHAVLTSTPPAKVRCQAKLLIREKRHACPTLGNTASHMSNCDHAQLQQKGCDMTWSAAKTELLWERTLLTSIRSGVPSGHPGCGKEGKESEEAFPRVQCPNLGHSDPNNLQLRQSENHTSHVTDHCEGSFKLWESLCLKPQ